jgi:hypothetical protein
MEILPSEARNEESPLEIIKIREKKILFVFMPRQTLSRVMERFARGCQGTKEKVMKSAIRVTSLICVCGFACPQESSRRVTLTAPPNWESLGMKVNCPIDNFVKKTFRSEEKSFSPKKRANVDE